MNLDLWQFFDSERSHILNTALKITQDRGWKIYAVGGLVRDGLMSAMNGSEFSPLDVDLVVDGGTKSGIEVAIALHRAFPKTKIQIYDKFQTALIEWDKFSLDIATSRTEIYEYAGANPQVQASSIDQDLYRRDFTINAFALEIGSTEVLDLFGGYQDLINKKIKVIRSGSFAEDPRRIFRAVRYAVRFGFALTPETETEIKSVTSSGLHDRLGGSRLKAELHYIFSPQISLQKAVMMLHWLEDLGGLRCIDPDLHLPSDLSLLLRRLKKWLGWFKSHTSFPEAADKLLLSYLEPQELSKLSQKLEICELLCKLPSEKLPSEIVKVLRTYQEISLIIFAVKSSSNLRRIIWTYFTQWQQVKPLLTGTDLKTMGCPEGKIMGTILAQIRNATIDGKVSTIEEAKILGNQLFQNHIGKGEK
jgi:tRNA nucleotidyltransferase (CCA-adding enzyme)